MRKTWRGMIILLMLLSGYLPASTNNAWSQSASVPLAETPDGSSADTPALPTQAIYLPLIASGNGAQEREVQAETVDPNPPAQQTQDPVPQRQSVILDLPLPAWQPPLGPPHDEEDLIGYNPKTGQERIIKLTGIAQKVGAAASSSGGQPPTPASAQTSAASVPTAPDVLGGFSRVNNTPDNFPWNAIVDLTVTFNGTAYHCNGALVDPKFVITSGSCVYNPDRGGWAQTIDVYPAYANGPSIWGVAHSVYMNSVMSWTQDHNLNRNWGLIELDRPIGRLTSWLGFGYNTSNTFYNRTINNPAFIDQLFLYNRSGQFDTIETEAFIHNGPFASNTNGSVVFLQDDTGSQMVHGVSAFSLANNTKTGFARMIKPIFDIFLQDILASTPNQADLIPLYVKTTPTVNAGEPIGAMTYRIHNYSSARYSGTINVKTYLSTNNIISTSDLLLQSHTVQPSNGIGPKSYTEVTLTSPPQIPLETPGGIYWIGVIIENADANTANNTTTEWDAARITVAAAKPHLRVSPSRLGFTTTEGGAAPAGQSISINNSGYGSFSWSASANQSWIMLQPTAGTNGASLNVSINMLAVPANQLLHNGEITISAPGTVEGSTKIQVSLTLTPPALIVNPDHLEFQATLVQPAPAPQVVNLTIAGAQTLNWQATSNSTWLKAEPTSGTGNGTLNVSIDSASLKVGTYTGQISLATGNAAETKINVSLNVVPGEPELQLNPPSLELSAIEGSNPGPQAIAIQSTVNYPFNWLTNIDAPWVINRRGAGHTPDVFVLSLETSALAPGEYSSTLIVTSPDRANKQWMAPIKLTVKPKGSSVPLMRVGPPSLTFAATQAGANPNNQLLLIENIGEGELSWHATSDASWLTLSQTSGGNGSHVSVAAKIDQLPPGIHNGQITINGGPAGTQIVSVILVLDQPPTLAVDGTNLVFSGLTGQPDPPAEQFTVRNAGNGNLTWEAIENLPWLSLNQSSGNAPATVQASATGNGLAVGVYTGNIDIHSNATVNSQQPVATKFLLRRGPTLGTYPHTLRFDAISGEGNPTPAEFEIQNVGRGDLAWRATSAVPWLTLAETQGNLATAGRKALRVVVQVGTLEPRDAPYTGQITVQTDNGDGGPQTLDVALTVSSKARYCRIPNGGADWILNTSYIKLRLENVERIFSADGGCDLKARLRANLPQNGNITANIDGHVDANNNFIPISSSPLILKIAYLELQLADKFSISDKTGIQAQGGTWKMPVDFGSKNQQFNGQIQIGPKGLSIAGESNFNLPSIEWGVTTMYNLKGKVRFSTDGAYVLDLTGDMRVGVKKSPDAVATGLQLTIDQSGIRSGHVGYFEVNDFAGMTLKVSEAVIENNQLRAQRTYLAVPKLWGGAEVTLYGLAIHKDGNVSVTGGKFKLPDIKAGGDSVKLTSLEGSLIALPGGGYEIYAKGVFGLNGLKSAGSCSLLVAVTVQTGVNASSVLTVASLNTQEAVAVAQSPQITNTLQTVANTNGLFLKEATVGLLNCQPGVALGPTGFFLTGVQGTIRLETPTRVEKVELKVWIESGAKIGPVPVISAVPVTTIYPDPFKLTFNAPVYFLRMKTNETAVEVTSRVFKTEVRYDYVVFHAGIGLEAGMNQANQFYVQGDGWATVGINAGALGKICDPTGVSGIVFGKSCVSIPDRNYDVGAADAHIDLDGVEGSVNVIGHRASFHFSFQDGSVSFHLSRLLRMVGDVQVAQARQNWQAYQRGEVVAAALDPQVHFKGNGGVMVAMPVDNTTPTLKASSVITTKPYDINMQSDVIFALVQPPTGTLTFSLIDPLERHYVPENLPSGITYEETSSITETQATFGIQQAMPGVWQAVVDGDTTDTPFYLAQFANVPPPVFNAISAEQHNDTEIAVNWQLLAVEPNTQINIYATNAEIMQTVTVSNLLGNATAEEIYLFAGNLLAENLTSATDGSPQTKTLNLSQLESGSYALWVEAIGPQGGSTRCYILNGPPGCVKSDEASPSPVRVQVSHPFPQAWSPQVKMTFDSKNGQLRLEWDENPHPDLNTYTLRIRHADPIAPTHLITDEITIPSVNTDMISTVVDNLEPGLTYTFSIGVGNRQSGNIVWAAEQSFTTPQPDFILAPQVNGVSAATVEGLTVQAGGTALFVPLGLDLSSNLPYPVEMYCDFAQLADGIHVEFDATAVAASVTAGRVTAKITATSTTPPGHYVIPLVARSGELAHDLHFTVEVLPTSNAIYLPLVSR